MARARRACAAHLGGREEILHLEHKRPERRGDHPRLDARRGEVGNDVHVANVDWRPQPLAALHEQQRALAEAAGDGAHADAGLREERGGLVLG